jgi:hypothetical protein
MPKLASDWKFATMGTIDLKKKSQKRDFVSSRHVLYFSRDERYKLKKYICSNKHNFTIYVNCTTIVYQLIQSNFERIMCMGSTSMLARAHGVLVADSLGRF